MACGVGLGVLASAAHLGWEATHGGVKTHHFLARPDMPGFSNWWGLLIVPLLGLLAARSVAGRVDANRGTVASSVAAMASAMLAGIAMSVAFATGYESITSVVFFVAVGAGVVLPTYRPEYAFGFVLGMLYVFGPVIPLFAVSIAVGVSIAAHFLIRPALAALLRRVRG